MEGVLSGTDGLEGEEQQHATCRGQEEDTTTDALDSERSASSPEQVPYSKDTASED